tara:strand:- start:933 stop:1121 length:189 start_codon:yes stop_codon:yes gene_type:complete
MNKANKLNAFLKAKENLIDQLCTLSKIERSEAVDLIIQHMKETEKFIKKMKLQGFSDGKVAK